MRVRDTEKPWRGGQESYGARWSKRGGVCITDEKRFTAAFLAAMKSGLNDVLSDLLLGCEIC